MGSLRSPHVEQGVWGMYPPLASLAHPEKGGMGMYPSLASLAPRGTGGMGDGIPQR